MSGPFCDEPADLSEAQRTYYLLMRVNHRNDPETGVCPVCDRDRCEDFVTANATLVSAGVVE